MKSAFFEEMRRFLTANQSAYEPDVIMPSARKAAQQVVKQKMDLFNQQTSIPQFSRNSYT